MKTFDRDPLFTNPYRFSQRGNLAAGPAIGKLMAQALKYPDFVSLAAGFVDNASLPCEAVERCLQRLMSDPNRFRRALQYDTTAGNADLRSQISQWNYAESPDSIPDPERVIVTAGSNQMLHLLAEAMLDPGDIILAAAPTYFVFIGTLRGLEARVVGVHADEDGICMDALEHQLEQLAAAGLASRVKAIYTVTEFDNPAGSTLSLERRHRLLEIVARWRRQHESQLMILSDKAYELLRYEGESLPGLFALDAAAQEFVIELGTFSKSFSPGIRVGWGVVPDTMVERLLEMKSNVDFGSPHFSQALVLDALRNNEVDQHVPVIRGVYQSRLEAMLSALDEHLGEMPGVHWRRPQGGLYVWLTLPEHVDASETGVLWQRAVEQGVLYVPGRHCFPCEGEPVARNSIRLSFGVQSETRIAEGVAKLAQALTDSLATNDQPSLRSPSR